MGSSSNPFTLVVRSFFYKSNASSHGSHWLRETLVERGMGAASGCAYCNAAPQVGATKPSTPPGHAPASESRDHSRNLLSHLISPSRNSSTEPASSERAALLC